MNKLEFVLQWSLHINGGKTYGKVPITEHVDYEIVCSSIKILYQCIGK